MPLYKLADLQASRLARPHLPERPDLDKLKRQAEGTAWGFAARTTFTGRAKYEE